MARGNFSGCAKAPGAGNGGVILVVEMEIWIFKFAGVVRFCIAGFDWVMVLRLLFFLLSWVAVLDEWHCFVMDEMAS